MTDPVTIKLSAADIKQIEDDLERAAEPSEKLIQLFQKAAVWEAEHEATCHYCSRVDKSTIRNINGRDAYYYFDTYVDLGFWFWLDTHVVVPNELWPTEEMK